MSAHFASFQRNFELSHTDSEFTWHAVFSVKRDGEIINFVIVVCLYPWYPHRDRLPKGD